MYENLQINYSIIEFRVIIIIAFKLFSIKQKGDKRAFINKLFSYTIILKTINSNFESVYLDTTELIMKDSIWNTSIFTSLNNLCR